MSLTQDDVMRLEGRALDATVAERVMGFRPCRFRETGHISGLATMWQCEHGTRRTCYPVNQEAVDHPHSPLHHYSTDIAAAWEVVERMRSKGFSPWLEHDGKYSGEWEIGFVDRECDDSYVAYDESVTRGVCRAALLAALERECP